MKQVLTLAVMLAACTAASAAEITGDTKYNAHGLVRLRAKDADPKAALLWRVNPSKDVQRATTPRGVLEFAAPPGSYDVELLTIRVLPDGAVDVAESRVTVVIGGTSPPKPDPKPPQNGKLDPVNALGRIQFGNAGCTATVIGPQRADGRWDVLTAAHCVRNGDRGSMRLKDGRTLAIRVVKREATSDLAWCVTDDPVEGLSYANLAASNPQPGVGVWHMGYGIDKPGNREDGMVSESQNSDGQTRFVLSVSSGDSGGGIFRTDTGELVSTVCCTSSLSNKGSMWGASLERIKANRPTTLLLDEWKPIDLPLRKEQP